MFVATCNRCGKPTRYSSFTFDIREYSISGPTMDTLDGPDVRLDDFHLCPKCMADFVDWIKEGKQDVK